ncbi:MAG: glycine oxidase ThiO [Thermomicrobia bacterium]|nr:glycine oxidase ThiO [Thermomicrobia bacterium]
MTMQSSGGSGEIVIIGGGIIGCAIAYELAKAGERVTLLERNALAQEASWASAGIISSPTPGSGQFGLRSFRRYPALIAEVEEHSGMRVGWNQTGETSLIGTDNDPRPLQDVMEWQRQQGLHVEWLEGTALRAHEPVLSPHITAAIYEHDAGSVRVHLMAQALARAATNHGATIREYTPALGLETTGDRVTGVRTTEGIVGADVVVLAAGAWSKTIGDLAGLNVPTIPVQGQMMAVADPPVPLRTVVAGGGMYLLPRADGTIAVGATVEHTGFAKRVTPMGINTLIALVEQFAPALNGARLVQTWSGLRPGTADGTPIIGPAPHRDGLWIATGHYRGGALLAAVTSELVAAGIRSGTVDPLLAPFAPARFA